MKVCKKCLCGLSLDNFGIDKSKDDGISIYCKSCNRDKSKQRKPESRKNTSLKAKYGITLEEYDKMFVAQGGLCKICFTATDKPLVVDHCHTSLKVRGLLCSTCNAGLGMFYDQISNLAEAIKYLKESE